MSLREDGVYQGVVAVKPDGKVYGTQADPFIMQFVDGTEVSIENATFNYDIRKVGQVDVRKMGAAQVLADDYAVPVNAMTGYSSGTQFIAVDDAHPLPVKFEAANQVDVATFAGEEFDAHQAIDYGQPLLQTAGLVYGWDEDGNQGLAIASLPLDGAPIDYTNQSKALVVENFNYAFDSTSGTRWLPMGGPEINGYASIYTALGDGFGNPIGSTFIVSGQSLNVASALFASDLTPLSANAGTFPYDNSLYELLVANDAVAWGGTAVSAAQDMDANNDSTYSIDGEFQAPTVGALAQAIYKQDGSGKDVYALHMVIPGDWQSNFDPTDSYGLATVASVDSWGGIKTAPADANGAIQVTGPSASNTSGVISTTGIITIGVNKLLQNFTAQLVWDGSVGTDTFTALLQGSYDGSTWITLATITEGTSGLKAQIQGYPYPYSRLNLSALSLDTATGITLNAAGMQ